MELVVLPKDLEPLPIRRSANTFIKPEGILNSNYKQVVKCDSTSSSSLSIFEARQQIKNRRFQFTNGIDVILKLSLFVITLAVIF